MASITRKFLSSLPQSNCKWLNFNTCSYLQVRITSDDLHKRLIIRPKEPYKANNRKNGKITPEFEEHLDIAKEINDEMESQFSEDTIISHGNQFRHKKINKKLERESDTDRQRLKRQIIKQKYFKPLKEENLLTWRAKEQIKFLHKTYPEEWSVSALAGTFPVSVYGVSKIVKSNIYGFSKSTIDSHDRKVIETWKKLSLVIKGKGSSEDERLNRIMYAGGIADLPFKDETTPVQKQRQQSTPFSDILKRCVPPEKLMLNSKTEEDFTSNEEVLVIQQNLLRELFADDQRISGVKYIERSNFMSYDSKKTITIPNKVRDRNKIYQKDKDVYDENGEFLYRIP